MMRCGSDSDRNRAYRTRSFINIAVICHAGIIGIEPPRILAWAGSDYRDEAGLHCFEQAFKQLCVGLTFVPHGVRIWVDSMRISSGTSVQLHRHVFQRNNGTHAQPLLRADSLPGNHGSKISRGL